MTVEPSSPNANYPLLSIETLVELTPEHLTHNLTDLVNYYGEISRLLDLQQPESEQASQLSAWLDRFEQQVAIIASLFLSTCSLIFLRFFFFGRFCLSTTCCVIVLLNLILNRYPIPLPLLLPWVLHPTTQLNLFPSMRCTIMMAMIHLQNPCSTLLLHRKTSQSHLRGQ